MSRKFVDNAGNTWAVKLDVWTIKRVRDVLDVDLLDLGDPDQPVKDQLLIRLVSDPVLLVDVLYVILQPAAESANVTDEDFGRAMAGDSIDLATKVLLEELTDFIPNPRDRTRARKVIAGAWELIDAAQDVLDRQAETGLAKVMETLTETPGDSSTSSPAESG